MIDVEKMYYLLKNKVGFHGIHTFCRTQLKHESDLHVSIKYYSSLVRVVVKARQTEGAQGQGYEMASGKARRKGVIALEEASGKLK